eukprot:GFUD01114269.1.p1 GENE.GFUD01114269.1~~GFUD01114269.1.p1  ORF type:complete len:521 (-),score=174.20 GFUD01114269.1:462-2024(-)
MGIHLDEEDLSELEPQIFKIFKKELGFCDSDILSNTMTAIHEGIERDGLESRLANLMEVKKAHKLTDEVWGIVSEYYMLKQESSGEGEGGYKRRHEEDDDDEDDYGKRKKYTDTWAKADRYNKEELDKVQKIPSKKPKVEPEEGSNPAVPSPSADQIKKMLANTQKMIEERKRQLNVVTPHQPAVLSHKAQQIAALQASIASKLNKVDIPKIELPNKPIPLIINDSGRTVDSSGVEIQLTQHVPTLKANLRAQKKEEYKAVKEEPAPVKEEGPDFFDPRVGMKGATRTKRIMKFHDAGKFQAEAQRLRMKTQLEKLQSEISSIARKTGISSATQLAKLVPKGGQMDKVPEIEWWDQLLIGSHNYENWIIRPGAISNLIEHPIQLKPMESNRSVHVPMFLTKKERKKLRRQNRREAWKEKQDKVRLGLVQPDEPKVKMSNLMRVLGNEQIMDPTKVEAHVRAQMAKRKSDHEAANLSRKLTPAQKKAKNSRKLQEDTSAGVTVSVYRSLDSETYYLGSRTL